MRCPTGEDWVAPAGQLAARMVIHPVGPFWRGGVDGEPRHLASSYRSCLALARDNGLKPNVFPAISRGAHGYPIADAARVAITETSALGEVEALPGRFVHVAIDRDVHARAEVAVTPPTPPP